MSLTPATRTCTSNPATSSQAKLYGHKTVSWFEAHRLGLDYIRRHGLTYIDAYYDDPKSYGGQGTIGIELLEQNPDIDTIVVPIGGGLITGIAVAAKALKPDIRIAELLTRIQMEFERSRKP